MRFIIIDIHEGCERCTALLANRLAGAFGSMGLPIRMSIAEGEAMHTEDCACASGIGAVDLTDLTHPPRGGKGH